MFDKKIDLLKLEGSGDDSVISIIASDFDDGDCSIDEKELKEELPILPLRNTVIFPGTSMPIAVGREKSKKLLKSLNRQEGKLIGLVCQKNADIEDPGIDDLYSVGVVGRIIRVIELPDTENITILIQAKKRFRLTALTKSKPFWQGAYELLECKPVPEDDTEFKVLLDSIRELTIQMLRLYGEPPKEFVNRIKSDSISYRYL